ncbi:hypothetical protein B1A99_02755 [Cohnella sp. CIP 111063]|uniref:DUF3221 domain-containing protein n=1 Tax=unclassified Cohnella TaxID=2636738 RepID=UPI000B8C34CB|nr:MULTISPECIES: DUF3221 domain-containing protein [unclassified Cohnella]OXS62786.1 hypothetical protein B1A99_02755 [Cohnella sp. CIP 111063]PRX75067.1 uncharacterized protein DUF3221 [Cohnella sp. SGD-V74]
MRRRRGVLLAFLAAFVVLLSACGESTGASNDGAGQSSEEPEFVYTGYIVDRKGDGILVTGSVKTNTSDDGGANHYYEATWFSNAGTEHGIGERVRVWPDGPIAESYPGQGKAGRVEAFAAQQPDGANLTEAEAIRKALEAPDAGGMFPPAVKEAEYKANTGHWRIELAYNGEARTVVVTVPDKQ